jgi:hypothetical protein
MLLSIADLDTLTERDAFISAFYSGKRAVVEESAKAYQKYIDAVEAVRTTADESNVSGTDMDLLYDYLDDAKAYCLGRGDLGLAVPSAGLEATCHFIVRQVDVYLTFFINLFKLTAIKVIFSTEDKMYAGLTERLNEKFSKGLGYYLEGRDYDALMAAEAEPEFEEVR